MGYQTEAKRKALEKAFRRQRGKCHLCGEPMNLSKDLTNKRRATADHVTPKSMGGAISGNIAAAHAECNYKRGNTHIQDYRATEGMKA